MKAMTSIGPEAFCICVLAATLGCSGSDSRAGNASGGNSSAVAGNGIVIDSYGTAGRGTRGADDDITFVRHGEQCGIATGESGCNGVVYEGENVPLDIHILLEQTGSMCSCVDPPYQGTLCPDQNCRKTRLMAIREAMQSFFADPASRGIKVSLTLFGFNPIGGASCNSAD